MPTLKVSGVNTVRAKGKVYYYHRASGTRIQSSPADPAAFAAEVAGLDALVPAAVAKPSLAVLTGVIAAYKGSPEWAALKPDTQKGYQRAFNALQPFGDVPAQSLEQKNVLTIRDDVYRTNGRWLANMTVSVLSIVLGWGIPRGHVTKNAAAGVPKIRRSKSLEKQNKAWTYAEADAILKRATGGLRKGIALAYFTGMRKKDVVELPREERTADGWIEMGSSKAGRTVSLFEAKRLTDILNEPDKTPGATVVVNDSGQPYTRDGFDTMFDRLKRQLVAEKLIRPGLTFHGLRSSLGKDAADLSFGENTIAGALGQANPASARPYTVEAQQRAAAKKVIRALERRGKR